MKIFSGRSALAILLVAAWCQFFPSLTCAAPTAEQAMALRPMQRDVNFDLPTKPDELTKCTVDLEEDDNGSAWVVRSQNGTILRRFIDTNADNKIDQWCYYQAGSEVYRDVDADYDERADHFRWMRLEGIRWGLDGTNDGVIDSWKMISAEEVTAEVVAALRDANARDKRIAQEAQQRFERLLLTKSELNSLGLGKEDSQRLARQISDAQRQFSKQARSQKTITDETKWMHFAAGKPGVLPAGTKWRHPRCFRL